MTTPHLDLDALAPEGKTLGFKGRTLYLPAEVPIPIVVRQNQKLREWRRAAIAQAERQAAEKEAGVEPDFEQIVAESEEQERILTGLHEALMDLLREGGTPEADLEGLNFTFGQIDRIFGFVSTGDPKTKSSDDAVLEALGGGAGEEEEAANPPTANRAARRAVPKKKKKPSTPRSVSKRA
jgi:hypothetical protein